MRDPILVYHAGSQVSRFRFLLYFSLACFGAAIIGFYWIAFVVEDSDLPNQERWLLALIVPTVGAAFFGGMLIYSHRYVVWLWTDDKLREVKIETMALFGEREQHFRIEDFASVDYDSGEMITRYHRIRTPYFKLRVSGQRLPYVIDLQGYISEQALFERLLATLSPK